MLLRSFYLNFELNARVLASIGPLPPFDVPAPQQLRNGSSRRRSVGELTVTGTKLALTVMASDAASARKLKDSGGPQLQRGTVAVKDLSNFAWRA